MSPRSWLAPTLVGAVLASWLVFVHCVLPGLIATAHEGRSMPSLNRLVQDRAGNRPLSELQERWLALADAGAGAGALWLVTLIVQRSLQHHNGCADRGRAPSSLGAFLLGATSLGFLGFTLTAGVRQDYYLYLRMWEQVRLGHDPWFLVQGVFGTYPLNAYGPLFNLLAIPASVNPLLPKLLFAASYVLFATWLIASAGRREGRPVPDELRMLVWFWNPFVWVEIAYYGHFDILVGLLAVAALESRSRGRDLSSGAWLGLGVLLKYMPIVLLPFLALEGKRIRWRLLLSAAGVIMLGLAASLLIWGPTTFRPLLFAARRSSHYLSIYRSLKGIYSPLYAAGEPNLIEPWAPLILMLALYRTWAWHRERSIATESAALIAMFVTVLFYQVGFPQYQMVPFVMASWWLIRHGQCGPFRRALWLAIAAYFGWLSAFNIIESRFDMNATLMQEWVGVPTFLLGCLVVVCLVRSAPRTNLPHQEQAAVHGA